MGAKISKEPIEKPRGYPPPPAGPSEPISDPFAIETVSPSRFYCLTQQAIVWPDYYAVIDLRPPNDFNKQHIVGARQLPADDTETEDTDDLSWAWDMLILIYGLKPTHPKISNFISKLQNSDSPPQGVYVLDHSVHYFGKRFAFVMSSADTADSLPGPVELVPPTARFSGTYGIHRVHFLRAKGIISRLYCSTIINISSRRLFVKTPGISLENTAFEEEATPEDFVVTTYLKYAGKKPNKKGHGNILIIDESGCDYASILACWHLIKQQAIPKETAIESVSARTGFLDPWYTDVIESWADEEN